MQQPILQIRDKLFTGLDQEYNVVDMGVVVDVLSQLENYAITKEALEATRLGKHINELRRKAQDKLLANRAKSLVKKWRQLLVVPSSGTGGGESLAAPTPSSNGRHLSPAVMIRPPLTNGRNTNTTSPGQFHSLPSSASTSPGLSRPPSPSRVNGLSPPDKTNPANKRLRKEEVQVATNKRPRNGESSDNNSNGRARSVKPDTLQRQMLSVRKASGKVLTTQDLVQQLALRSQSPPELLQEEKETLPSSQQETNSQLMSRFFDSQERLSPPTSATPPDSGPSTRCSSAAAAVGVPGSSPDEVEAILSQLPPINRDEILAELQREFPPGEPEEDVDDEDIDGLIPVKKEEAEAITEDSIQRLHTDQVESLTGNFDTQGTFHEWHEVVGKATKEGDLLYILPYCIID